MMDNPDQVVAVILAGGEARRMGGGDKVLMSLGDKPLLYHVLDRLTPQCNNIILNANGDPARFKSFGLPVIPDSVTGQLGPLAGILSGMDAVAINYPTSSHMLSLAGDTPFIPVDLLARMMRLSHGQNIVRACSGGRAHPVFALWPLTIRADLRDQLINHDIRKIDRFTASYDVVDCVFDGIPDPFFNINHPEDRIEAERSLKQEK
jgi:molybdopterin-guanine dinucleotide biosynthesis protein A